MASSILNHSLFLPVDRAGFRRLSRKIDEESKGRRQRQKFTDVDRVLPVLQYLSDDKDINVGPVFALLVLERHPKNKKTLKFPLNNMQQVKTQEDGANVTSNTPTKRPKVPFTPACLKKREAAETTISDIGPLISYPTL